MTADAPLWVFAYGSLMWNPEFEVAEASHARLPGWRRGFCMRSLHHRGTPEVPGLVLALDAHPDGHCEGLALRAAPGHEAQVLRDVRARELVSAAYQEQWLSVDLADGRQIRALTFVIDRGHAQYCAHLSLAEQARIIATAQGGRGRNADYLFSTVAHLAAIGRPDPELDALATEVRRLTGGAAT